MKKLLIILTTLTLIGCEYDPDRYYLVETSLFGNKSVRSKPLRKDECILEKTNEDARLKIENDTTSTYDCILIK